MSLTVGVKGGRSGMRGGPTQTGDFTCPACQCDRCWKRASISDIRPASGTRRWLHYIFGERNKIHIINLEKTQPLYAEAANFHQERHCRRRHGAFRRHQALRARSGAARGRALRPALSSTSAGSGGMLTNFKTIRQSIKRLAEITELLPRGALEKRGKKEATQLRREMDKLERSLGGIKDMDSLPDAHVRDRRRPRENRHSRGPETRYPGRRDRGHQLLAGWDRYVIPGNDDAMRAIQLVCGAAWRMR